jgi:putative YphP/YqiW family bacilliredoxin
MGGSLNTTTPRGHTGFMKNDRCLRCEVTATDHYDRRKALALTVPGPYNRDSHTTKAGGTKRMYPEIMVIPMREELTRVGIKEARTAEEVDAALAQPGTTMLVVNSICGCAAGKMRPGVRLALRNAVTPDQSITVFAGQDREATERARSYFAGQPPTSPAVAILRDGKLVYLMQRFVIESNPAPAIGQELARAFNEFCVKTTA